jgi:YD repeat-containing protein
LIRQPTHSHDFSSTAYDLDLGLAYTPANQIRTREASNDAFAWSGHANVDLGYTANNLNQLKTAGATALTYDANGNLTGDGTHAFVYDIENRLTQETAGGQTLSYDPAGRLYQTGPATTRFAYDGTDLVGEYDASGQLQRRYVFGPGVDEPLVWYEGSGTDLRRWYAADERGSTIAVTNGNGAATKLYAYDEYGVPQLRHAPVPLHRPGLAAGDRRLQLQEPELRSPARDLHADGPGRVRRRDEPLCLCCG